MRELALFAGAGGGILGGLLLGWRTVCAIELDPFCRKVLLARQRDGHLEHFPIWDDVRTFDGKPWRGSVDIVSGGFPCQDISAAGKKKGITGSRSSLWLQMARIIGEVRPQKVYVENSPDLIHRGLGSLLGSLSSMGFSARWGVVGARHAGAPHKRDRLWILGNADSKSKPAQPFDDEAPRMQAVGSDSRIDWWNAEPVLDRVDDGVADRLDRLRALGNGQVPAVAALAWRILNDD